MSDVTILGMDAILKKLKVLPERVQKNVLVGAIRASAKPMIKEAKSLVPVDSGTLKKSIGIVKNRSKDRNIISFSVAPKSKAIHKALSKNKSPKWMVSKISGRRYLNIESYARTIEFGHGVKPAHPFMRPAFDKKGAETIDEAKKYMTKRIDKEIAKLWLKKI